jgi:PAS domain-containing protein
MPCESDILPIISKIYDSILDPGCCAEIGEALVRLAGGHIGVLVTHSGARSMFFPDMAYNVDVKARDAYLAHYDRISPFHSLERLSRPGQIITASHLVTSTDYKKSAFYNEFARKRDHWDYLGIMLSKDAAAMTGFAILRPHQAGLVTPLEIERMKAIAPHLQRAFMIKNRLNESRTQVSVLESAIDGTGFGVVVATANGGIAYANRAAENLLRGGRGLRCERGRISATDSPTAHKLQALITAASRLTEDAAPGGSLLVPDESGTVSLAIHVIPFSQFLRNSFRKGTTFRWSFYRRPHPRTQRPRQAVRVAFPVDAGRNARARRSDLGRRDRKSFRTAQDYRTYGAYPSQTHCGKDRHPPAGGTREIVLRDDNPRSGICKAADHPWLAGGSKSLIS